MQNTAWNTLFCMKLKSFNKISMDIYFTELYSNRMNNV
jgi:hypothetical protein